MAFLQTDDDAFQAALSFVDEFAFGEEDGGHASPNTQLLEGVAVSPHCPEPVILGSDEFKQRRRKQENERKRMLRKAGVYADPNRARNERRQEIARLREQLGQLQLDVRVLRSRESKEPQNAQSSRNSTSLPPQVPAVWQELAARQRFRREKAEKENVRLRLVAERQRQVALSLGDLVRRRALQATKEYAALSTQPCLTHVVVNVLDTNADMEDFRLLLSHLEIAYQRLDAVFAANGSANARLSPGDVHLREGIGGRYLECFSHKMLPFEMRATTEVTWEHFKGVEKHFGNGSLYAKAAKNLEEPQTIIENFTKELHSDASRADIRVKQVVRRYVEPDRDIIIWVSRVAPAQIKHKMLRGLTYHLQGYAVTKRSPESIPGQELSVFQQCSLISLDHDADVRCESTNLHALMNFLVVNTAQNIRAHRERIENMLVDRAVARRVQ
ncbi:hypothetical protein PHYPSEUDO_005552 [Phytophthora pseudosyringae]|uniref:M96 mating-specific protein family n=1 Tax=Phytophthora pseudosyringae TaxID=221518 RepID=A0A8T1WDB1_9STRA|nr:hypothetical protein PHYPSEUDO_005552 [Phytophthora pseudosyringae]